MPWMRGRFYMNPFYGRALERARESEGDSLNPGESDSGIQSLGGHWVTINGRHVLIDETDQDTKGQRKAAHHTRLDRRPGHRTSRIIFNETSGLRAANGNSDDLHDARVAMAHAILNGHGMHHRPSTVTDVLTPSSARAILTDPEAKAAWMDAQAAAQEAAESADDTSGAIHFISCSIRLATTGPIGQPRIGKRQITGRLSMPLAGVT